jgi:hypothetical protein
MRYAIDGWSIDQALAEANIQRTGHSASAQRAWLAQQARTCAGRPASHATASG